jgi:hypothetical protein
MSKGFLGHTSANRDHSSATNKGPKEDEQVAVLYELGLLSRSSDKKRRREKGKGRDRPGGAGVAGSRSRKGAHQFSPSPLLATFTFIQQTSQTDLTFQ